MSYNINLETDTIEMTDVNTFPMDVIQFLKCYTSTRQRIRQVFPELHRLNCTMVGISHLKLMTVLDIVKTNPNLIKRVIPHKNPLSIGALLDFLKNVCTQVPDKLVIERLRASGIAIIVDDNRVYLSDQMDEDHLCNRIIEVKNIMA